MAEERIASGGVVTERDLAPTYEGDFVLEEHLLLECGRTLVNPTLHYAVYGRLNAARDNAVLVCHALSGSALVGAWWPGLFGTKTGGIATEHILRFAQDDNHKDDHDDQFGIVDLERDCVICVNLLGSCYGSTGPGSVDEETGEVYGPTFPLVSIRDNVQAQTRLLDSLEIDRLKLAIGGSVGGMQVLEWAMLYPERVGRVVMIGVAPLSAMGLALNHLQRQAIQGDPEWLAGNYLPQRQPRHGLALARKLAMLSYKSPELFAERFGRNPNRNGEDPWGLDEDGGGLGALHGGESRGRFDVAGYLDLQGDRFLERFDANAYLAILRMMDTWDPVRGFDSAADAFGRVHAEVTVVGISSDWLFPPQEVRALAEALRAAGVRAVYREMATAHGHDAFLAEQRELVKLLRV